MTVYETGMPPPATQSMDTFKETKYKIDSVLCQEQLSLLLHCTMATVSPGFRACDIMSYLPIHFLPFFSSQAKAQTPFS